VAYLYTLKTGELRLHPDGRRVAIGDVKVDLEVWVMENFLPKEVREKK
jgi:hypothetical protein